MLYKKEDMICQDVYKRQSLCLKQPELIVTQLHFLMVEIILALNVRISLETLN